MTSLPVVQVLKLKPFLLTDIILVCMTWRSVGQLSEYSVRKSCESPFHQAAASPVKLKVATRPRASTMARDSKP